MNYIRPYHVASRWVADIMSSAATQRYSLPAAFMKWHAREEMVRSGDKSQPCWGQIFEPDMWSRSLLGG